MLDDLAEDANVAQFVSFDPALEQRYCRIGGFAPNHSYADMYEAVDALFRSSVDHSVNIRSFLPELPEANEFIYGLQDRAAVMANLERLSTDGLYTIVNETIDVHDGGVSGVILGNIIEFTPGDTPRGVEKEGVAGFPRDVGCRLLHQVYGFKPALDAPSDHRVEFSIHPIRRGWLREHTVIWQSETVHVEPMTVVPSWPNNFSRLLGDKAFGLLIAQLVGLKIPRTRVIARRVAPFEFGTMTDTGEIWTRTCPVEPQPGRFVTVRGWTDPYRLLQDEDPSGIEIASVISQDGVDAEFAGALIVGPDGQPTIEGVHGTGEDFMLGIRGPERIPDSVAGAVRHEYELARSVLGPVRLEWAYDGNIVWTIQMHRGATESEGRVIVPGTAVAFSSFDVARGIEDFREVVEAAAASGHGIVLLGHVGITSHFGDIARRARVPTRIEFR